MTSQLRDDVRQCLIVAPGGLVEQWQDELFLKFGLRFDLLTNQLVAPTSTSMSLALARKMGVKQRHC